MKKFGFYKDLAKKDGIVEKKEPSSFESKPNTVSKTYAYKMFLDQHQTIINNINAIKKEGK